MTRLTIPIPPAAVQSLRPGDQVEISGKVLCGRDAVLPKVAALIAENRLHELPVSLEGAVIFHTAVSVAGIGPTTSNKKEIEGTMLALSRAGVRVHLGKGAIGAETVRGLAAYPTLFAVTLPTTALFMSQIRSQRVVAWPELGMEALYEVDVAALPAIVAAAGGQSLFAPER